MSYIEEFAYFLQTNYLAMKVFLTVMFVDIVLLVMFIVPLSAGVVTAIFWPRKLPPFYQVMGDWTMAWLKIWGLILYCVGFIYVFQTWEEAGLALLALSIVILPLSILIIYKDAKYTGVITAMLLGLVYIGVLIYTLSQSLELRYSYGISIYMCAFCAIGYYLGSKWSQMKYPKAVTISAISGMLLIPILVTNIWVYSTIPSWEWPDWYQSLIYPFVALLITTVSPGIYVEFWLPMRGTRR